MIKNVACDILKKKKTKVIFVTIPNATVACDILRKKKTRLFLLPYLMPPTGDESATSFFFSLSDVTADFLKFKTAFFPKNRTTLLFS